MTDGQIEKYIDLIFSFQGEEEVTRETLIKNHFTQRIAELSSQVNIRKLAIALFVMSSICLCYTSVILAHSFQSLQPAYQAFIFKSTHRERNRERVRKNKEVWEGQFLFPHPSPLPISSHFFCLH